MKKTLSILCLSFIMLAVASCKKETIVQGNTNQTVYATNVSNWELTNDGGGSYVVDIPVSKLDKTYSEYGAVLVYITRPGGTEWEQIPEIYGGRAFSFTHDVGRVSIYAQNPTGTLTKPDPIDVKIVLIDSNVD
ncbi:hypothetical protein DYU05_17600 [Mucilaginibacter terrenus]|uniref:Uncharacterized protein n=1 Tax=Mucilaginibacter terrenus TaxID=2482727 RepID=A0A3E2NL34_9SPHI|nr:hypothetical protein [Mucilaginibacter terrenus]RFZ81643.1 hypothetical protein DYU05_17600 [Mucilaginibacter terrenus]